MALTNKFLKSFYVTAPLKNFRAALFSTDNALHQTKWAEHLEFSVPNVQNTFPIYRVLNENGAIIRKSEEPRLDKNVMQRAYEKMVLVNAFDKALYESQRQGRISFYLTSFGEEAVVGSAMALKEEDIVYSQYRESVVFLWKGYTISEMMDQCFGNVDDRGKGRQMPLAYGSKNSNLVTVSSPIASRMPQAVGAAYAVKGKERVVICYFGEGASSEGDAHAAFNFASTLECPVIFFCRNNGYAISTPTSEQFKGDGVAAYGCGYGMQSIKVDGNDIFAIYNATKKAKEYCLKENKPVLIEAMTYRISHHSTSDDSSAYRSIEELKEWTNKYNPIERFRKYLENNELWSSEKEIKLSEKIKQEIKSSLNSAENKLKPNWIEMFNDVYTEMPQHIRKQKDFMRNHMEKYGDKYPLNKYASV